MDARKVRRLMGERRRLEVRRPEERLRNRERRPEERLRNRERRRGDRLDLRRVIVVV